MASSSLALGPAGLQLPKTSSLLSSSDIKSGSLTPRFRDSINSNSNTVVYNTDIRKGPDNKVYKGPDNIEITRYLIDRGIDDPAKAEIDALNRAINHIKASTILSKEQLMATVSLPRTISKSNVVLIDILVFKNGKYDDGFHTMCLWKIAANDVIVIDPNNSTIADSFLKRHKITATHNSVNLTVRGIGTEKFYKPVDSERVYLSPQIDDTKHNKDSRDCIDLAVKIALTINAAQATAMIPEAIDYQIDRLSNQSNLNIGAAIIDDLPIGFLQSSDAKIRETSFLVLSQNKQLFEAIKNCFKSMNDIGTWDDFLRLNQIGLKFYEKARSCGLTKQSIANAAKMVDDALKEKKSEKKPAGPKVDFDLFESYLLRAVEIEKQKSEADKQKSEAEKIIKGRGPLPKP